MLETAARAYSAAFAPEFFLFCCALSVLGYEWREAATRTRVGLGARVGVLGLGWVVAFAVYAGVPDCSDRSPAGRTSPEASASASVCS